MFALLKPWKVNQNSDWKFPLGMRIQSIQTRLATPFSLPQSSSLFFDSQQWDLSQKPRFFCQNLTPFECFLSSFCLPCCHLKKKNNPLPDWKHVSMFFCSKNCFVVLVQFFLTHTHNYSFKNAANQDMHVWCWVFGRKTILFVITLINGLIVKGKMRNLNLKRLYFHRNF